MNQEFMVAQHQKEMEREKMRGTLFEGSLFEGSTTWLSLSMPK